MARRRVGVRGRWAAAALVASALATMAAPASAVVGGTPTGAAYGNVGLLSDGCSSVLVSPTVVLTAAHCAGGEFEVGDMQVTFATDGTGPWISGTAHFDSRYLDAAGGPGTKVFLEQSKYDVGVLVLDHPAAVDFPGIVPASLPILGALDSLAKSASAKRSDAFTLVGYGSTRSGANPHSFVFDDIRRVATGPLFRLDPYLLWIKSNPNASWGSGNPCYGDSGGPAFVTGTSTVGGVVSFGKDPDCQNGEGYARVDTASARSFLSTYVAVP